jgi:hypothetical protein
MGAKWVIVPTPPWQAEIGKLLEDRLEGAQDVEGAVVDEDIYIVQARPQP